MRTINVVYLTLSSIICIYLWYKTNTLGHLRKASYIRQTWLLYWQKQVLHYYSSFYGVVAPDYFLFPFLWIVPTDYSVWSKCIMLTWHMSIIVSLRQRQRCNMLPIAGQHISLSAKVTNQNFIMKHMPFAHSVKNCNWKDQCEARSRSPQWQNDSWTDYCNSRCACAPRVNDGERWWSCCLHHACCICQCSYRHRNMVCIYESVSDCNSLLQRLYPYHAKVQYHFAESGLESAF